MVDSNAIKDLLIANIEGTATWRRQKVTRDGGDSSDLEATTQLLALRNSFRSRSCRRLLSQLARICAEADDRTLFRFSEIEADLLREIGFSTEVSTADGYLHTLIARFDQVASNP